MLVMELEEHCRGHISKTGENWLCGFRSPHWIPSALISEQERSYIVVTEGNINGLYHI